MADWDYDAKTFVNVNDENVADNLVRDLFLDRDGEMTVGEWQAIWANAGAGIMHTTIGHTALVTSKMADKALRSFMEPNGPFEPFCIVEDEQRLVWPIQKACLNA